MSNRLQTLRTYLSRSFNTKPSSAVPKVQTMSEYLTGRESQQIDRARSTARQHQEWAWERERELRSYEYMHYEERVAAREAYRDSELYGREEWEAPWDGEYRPDEDVR